MCTFSFFFFFAILFKCCTFLSFVFNFAQVPWDSFLYPCKIKAIVFLVCGLLEVSVTYLFYSLVCLLLTKTVGPSSGI